MDAEQLIRSFRAELEAQGVPEPSIRLGDNNGFYWVATTATEPNGQKHTYSVRIGRDATPLEIQIAVAELKSRLQDE